MAKRKNEIEVTQADFEDMAYVLVRLFEIINPQINVERAYPIVLELVASQLDEASIVLYGQAIRATAHETSQTH